MTYRVRPGRLEEANCLGRLEAAAARRFAGIGMERIAGGRPTSPAAYRALAAEGLLWVVENQGAGLAGLAIAGRLDGQAYLAEVAVHPDHAGHKLAMRLIAAVEGWAVAQGFTDLSLTTFRNVPWNRPYYERLGFHVVEEGDLGPQLAAVRHNEKSRGLDEIGPRVAMTKAMGVPA